MGGKYYFETPFIKYELTEKSNRSHRPEQGREYLRFKGKKLSFLPPGGSWQPAIAHRPYPHDVMSG
jgi:hypothetical protein